MNEQKRMPAPPEFRILPQAGIFLLAWAGIFAAEISATEVLDRVGYSLLREKLGEDLPDGRNVTVALIEWDEDRTIYAPDPAGELGGRQYHYVANEPSGWFPHATRVARHFFGRRTSIAPGVPEIYSFGFSAYLAAIQTNRASPPFGGTWQPEAGEKPAWEIENHSWIASHGRNSSQILRRVDYSIDRNNIFVSAGLNNATDPMQPLLANFYNGIAVGRSSGVHNRGGSTAETPGRMKPDIVAPAGSTSHATALVSSAAAILIDRAKRSPDFRPARNTPVLKALLMAGATKAEFPAWSHSPERPLDRVFGAGQLNIYNSYRILDAGRRLPGEEAGANSGWDWNRAGLTESRRYPFQVPKDTTAKLSAILTWNRNVVPAPDYRQWDYTRDLLSLSVWERDDEGNPALKLDWSKSPLDNVAHLYRELPPGRYLLEVEFLRQGTRYVDAGGDFAPAGEFPARAAQVPVNWRFDVPYGLAWRLDRDTRPASGDLPSLRQVSR